MDSGIAALIAAAIATLGTLGGSWLNDYLASRKKNPTDEAAKRLLRSLLERPQWRWASIYVLANVVGRKDVEVKDLLLEIGARGSMKDGILWGLISRNPISEQDIGADPERKTLNDVLPGPSNWDTTQGAARNNFPAPVSNSAFAQGREIDGEFIFCCWIEHRFATRRRYFISGENIFLAPRPRLSPSEAPIQMKSPVDRPARCPPVTSMTMSAPAW